MNERAKKVYKSPRRKLVSFFEKSRNQWKSKYMEAKATVKRLNNRIRYLENSKAEWKDQAKELQKELDGIKAQEDEKETVEPADEPVRTLERFAQTPAYHTYSLGDIELFVTLVLSAAASLRGAGRTLEIVRSFFGVSGPCPSWYAGRFWLLRIGYYKLMRPKAQAEDWVWIVDHTVQLGAEKALLILGVRLSQLARADLVLSHEDVEPIALFPVTHSNGEVVFEQLEETTEKTGVPREILGDHGSDLKAGIERFVQAHPQACYIYDVKHKGATLLKHELHEEETWKAFTQKAAQTKSQVQQTALAFLNPPNQRTKARYMNLAILIRWAQRVLSLLDKLEKTSRHRERYKKLIKKLGWLREFREPLEGWAALLKLVITTEEFVRTQGLRQGCEAELEKRLVADVDTPSIHRVREQLLAFVKDQSSKVKLNECLLGSSEIIESVLGKLKQLEQNQAKSGFTSLLLAVAAIVSQTTQEVVQRAMETVPTKKVIEWTKKHLGPSVQSKRKIAFRAADNPEQIWDQLLDDI